jgi:drug/metabolite transporter (DMT)-like permease
MAESAVALALPLGYRKGPLRKTSMPLSPARLRDLALLVLVPLFFSTNMVIARFIVDDTGPWTVTLLRWLIAALILLPFAAGGLSAVRRALAAEAWLIVALAFLAMWVCGGVVYTGLRYTTATNAILIYTSSSVLILILEWMFRGRRLRLREILGTALAFAGVAVVALGGEMDSGFRLNPGDVLIFLGALAWALYSVLLKRPGLAALPGAALFVAIILVGIALLVPMSIWELARGERLPASPGAWLAIAAIALIPSVGAYSGYQYGIRKFGTATMAAFSYLITPFGVLLAVLVLGEALRAYHLVGFALILPGVVLATARGRARPPPSPRAAAAVTVAKSPARAS